MVEWYHSVYDKARKIEGAAQSFALHLQFFEPYRKHCDTTQP